MEVRIGITGVAGFIGSNLADRLIASGYSVFGLDDLSMGLYENIAHHERCSNFKFQKADVRGKALSKFFKDVDIIVHLAAFKIPRYGNELDTLLINTEGTKNVLELAKLGKKRVVFASTSDVYGKNPIVPFNENHDSVLGAPYIKRWGYAVSKMYDEHLCFAYQDAFDIPITILRIFGSYGPRQHLSWWGGPQSVFISAILNDEEITIHGDGKQTRSFTYIDDTVNGIVAAIEKEEAIGEIFNIGNTHEITIIKLANLIKDIIGKEKIKIAYLPYTSFPGGNYEDVRRRVPDISKAERILNFVPKIDLRQGLRKTIEWQRRTLNII